jgi:hypothetical protein
MCELNNTAKQEHEDRRQAVLIGVTLSTYLITAALAVISVLGMIIAGVIEKELPTVVTVNISCFGIFCLLAFLFFIFSIVNAGWGIDAARKNGYEGQWDLASTKQHFNRQAGFCFAGLVFFVISVLCLIF